MFKIPKILRPTLIKSTKEGNKELYLFGGEEIVICVGNDSLANNSRFRFNGGHFCASGPPEGILTPEPSSARGNDLSAVAPILHASGLPACKCSSSAQMRQWS